MGRLGLVLDTFKIKHISDNEGYLDAIARKKNAQVRRDTQIVEAEAEAEARLAAAEAKKKGSVAEREAEVCIVEAENRLRVRKDGKATAEAIRLMREQWEKEDTRELFLIQQLPEILDKVTSVISENLSIDKVTVVDSGNGNGLPSYIKGITGSIVAIFEQIKNATGLDIPDILRTSRKTAEGIS